MKGQDRHIADLVARARFRGRDGFFLLHTEPMARTETRIPWPDVSSIFGRLFEEYALPTNPTALFSD